MFCLVVSSRKDDCLLSGWRGWWQSPETGDHGRGRAMGHSRHSWQSGPGSLAQRRGGCVNVLLLVLLLLLLAPGGWGACWRGTGLGRRPSPLLLVLLLLLLMLWGPMALGGRGSGSRWRPPRWWWLIYGRGWLVQWWTALATPGWWRSCRRWRTSRGWRWIPLRVPWRSRAFGRWRSLLPWRSLALCLSVLLRSNITHLLLHQRTRGAPVVSSPAMRWRAWRGRRR